MTWSVGTSRLDGELAAWRSQPLNEHADPSLSVDARYEHVRLEGRVVSHAVLVVAVGRDDGVREVLAVEVADTESEASDQAEYQLRQMFYASTAVCLFEEGVPPQVASLPLRDKLIL